MELHPDDSVTRELVLLKVKANNDTRSNIIEITNIFRAHIVDVSRNNLILLVAGDEGKIEAFINMLEPFGILEIIRSGTSGLQRGDKVLKA